LKLLRTIVIFDNGSISDSEDWQRVFESLSRSINHIEFPPGSGSLTIRKKIKRSDGQWDRNGVGYLKGSFLQHMTEVEGWKSEKKLGLSASRLPVTELSLYPGMELHSEPVASDFGGFDFVSTAPKGLRVAIEWETGNISSSHRSMNKLAIALGSGVIEAGVLIVPSRELYEHLTDRVGNISELSGYLTMWRNLGLTVGRGLLAIVVVEHDALTCDPEFPFLRVGDDGRAKEGRKKRK
jgi:hypothetical protein